MTQLCRTCAFRRVYGRFQDCLACRMEQRHQDGMERRRRKQMAIERLCRGFERWFERKRA